jgi:hypothetical protein
VTGYDRQLSAVAEAAAEADAAAEEQQEKRVASFGAGRSSHNRVGSNQYGEVAGIAVG